MARTRAFTLVELLIVIIILAVLSAVIVPKFTHSSIRTKEASLRENLRLLREAGDRCEADTGVTVDITALVQSTPPASGWVRGAIGTNWTAQPVDASTWRGPYLNSVPVNPILGTNNYITGGGGPTAAWTHYSNQSFNKSYYYFPSTDLGSNAVAYRRW